jgi:cytochrome P450
MTVVSAGTHTTRHALCTGTVHILQKPEIQKKLLEELVGVMARPDETAPYSVLEKLPYLVRVFLTYIVIFLSLSTNACISSLR